MKHLVILGLILVLLTVPSCGLLPGGAPPTPTSAPSPVPTLVPPTLAPTSTPVPTATPTPAPPTPTLASPLDVLTKAFRGLSGVKTYRAKVVTTGLPKGATQESTFEVVLPDRFHLTSAGMEVILIGKTAYVKLGTKWQKAALPKGIDMSIADPKALEASLGISTNIKLVGTDDLEGKPTFVYQYTTTIKGPPAQTFASKMWVDAASGLPAKSESELKTGQKTTTTFYDYNATITINPPL